MLPTRAIHHSAVAAVSQSAGTFNPAGGSEQKLILFTNDPTLTQDTVLEDLTQPTFTGYAAIECGAGAPGVAIDPVTGQWSIRPNEPAGGFEWLTSDEDGLPATVFGFALVNQAGTVLIAAQKFDTPKVLTAADQVVDVPQPTITFPVNFML